MTAHGDDTASRGGAQARRGWSAGRKQSAAHGSEPVDATVPLNGRRRSRAGIRRPQAEPDLLVPDPAAPTDVHPRAAAAPTGPPAPSGYRPQAPPPPLPEPHRDPQHDEPPTERYPLQPPPTPRLAPEDVATRELDAPVGRSTSRQTPRKLTVTRVAAMRSKQLTRDGLRQFHRAASADGADKSGLTSLTYATMANYASDAAIAVALANTLFFAAATGESKTKVALYLLITVAPFAVIAPLIGPALDRIQRGRRLALAGSFVARAVLAVVMALNFNSWQLYPAALGVLVFSKSFGVLKSSVMPRVLPPGISLVKSNSRLTVFGLVGTIVVGGIAGVWANLFGSGGALWFSAAVMLLGAWLCMRIPKWVEVTEGEVRTSLVYTHSDDREARSSGRRGKATKQPLSALVLASLWGTGSTRVLTGFITLYIAFVAKATAEGGLMYAATLGAVGVGAGLGNFVGNAIGARLTLGKPDLVIIWCATGTLAMCVVAALVPGLPTAALATLVGASGSALAKVSLDATMQRDLPEEARASAFGRSETVLQLAWVLGGAMGVLLPPNYWVGFTVISVLLALGTAQAALTRNGRTLLPGLGGDRPIRTPTAEPVG